MNTGRIVEPNELTGPVAQLQVDVQSTLKTEGSRKKVKDVQSTLKTEVSRKKVKYVQSSLRAEGSTKKVEESLILEGKRRIRQSSLQTAKDASSILIIGVTGRTGLACLKRFGRDKSKPEIHAFCRDPSKISKADKQLCQSIIEGDARDEDDVKRALKQTKANIVVVCIGDDDKFSNNLRQAEKEEEGIRTASAKALVNVMKKKKCKHVRALVISRLQTNDSQFRLRLRMGMRKARELRRTLEDHAGQEAIFMCLKDRITIVRPTALLDTEATGKIQEFRTEDKPPTRGIPRNDLASWIAGEVCCGFQIGGRIANITRGTD